jgi:signal transduction histidine kinase
MTLPTLSWWRRRVVSPSDDFSCLCGVSGLLLRDDAAIARQDDDRGLDAGYARFRMSFSALIDRVRGADRQRLELLLTAFIAVEVQVEAALLATQGVDGDTRATVHALLLLLPVAFYLRRSRPVLAVLLAQIVFAGAQAHPKAVPDNLYLPLFVVLVVSVSAAMYAEGRRFWLVPLITFTGGATGAMVDEYGGNDLADLLWVGVIFSGLTAAVGRLLRNRASLQAALREKTARLERDRATRAEQAAMAERERIAGDLHDIIAHALSGMVIQASAARRLSVTDADKARLAFGAVEDSGREALAELRRLLGVLRREDEELALAPTPSLSHVESLVRRARTAGLPVDLVVEGEPVALPAGVDLTAYRVLQDALGAALEDGAAGRARVRVLYGGTEVELEVHDDGHGRDGDDGRRMLGMRERVSLVGGELHAGRPRGGGYAVRARLPLEAPA